MTNKNTIILGLGNPILTDDSAGIKIARRLKEANPELEVVETSEDGIGLLDLIVGYDRLIIIDSIKTGQGEPGELYEIDPKSLKPTMDFSSSHNIGIITAFEMGRRLEYHMPQHTSIYAVEIKDNTTFSEDCTQELEARIPAIAEQITGREKL